VSIKKESIDVVISFDTTGSMYPCLTQVRRNINDTVRRLHDDIPNLRVGIIAHGDYCDGPRAITKLDLTADIGAICRFVSTVQSTGGGDAPECYELALHEARSFSWSAGKNKALVLIGDDVPHPVGYPLDGYSGMSGRNALDWRNELGLLVEAGIHVHAVQALGNMHATPFYTEVAKLTGGFHLPLHQFSHVNDLLLAICYKQSTDPAQFFNFEKEVQNAGRMDRGLHMVFTALGGRGAGTPGGVYRKSADDVFGRADLAAVHPSRFQVLKVDREVDISEFVSENGLVFKIGRGFYELTSKTVKVQDHKEVVLVAKRTGDMFSGAAARRLLELPEHGTIALNPKANGCKSTLDTYRVFIQSTSANRKLLAGSRFLYEVDRSDGRAW
jgi:hypothetical protein